MGALARFLAGRLSRLRFPELFLLTLGLLLLTFLVPDPIPFLDELLLALLSILFGSWTRSRQAPAAHANPPMKNVTPHGARRARES